MPYQCGNRLFGFVALHGLTGSCYSWGQLRGGMEMKENWPLAAGMLLIGAGALLAWQDIGGPGTGFIFIAIGLLIMGGNLIRRP